ncbi:ZIP family metal transporter [Demequina sp. SO4-13]|uniref:ZIP family metal transporter n=1 Tax=Demequina sp. SO4-13 TaxID=3401027 RepID=UPI003AF4A8FE
MAIATEVLAALLGVSPLLLGAAIAWRWRLSTRVVASVVAWGAGALLATLAYELVRHSNDVGGIWPVVGGFAAGTVLYVAADAALLRAVKKNKPEHEPESRNPTAKRGGSSEGGVAHAVGAVLDNVPQALIIGITAGAGAFPTAAVVVIGLSNVTGGLSGTVPLKNTGRTARAVFVMWAGIVLAAVIAAVVGAELMSGASGDVRGVTLALAAGALLGMVVNSMIPEAVATDHWATGLITSSGFLTAFAAFELL